MKEIIKTSKNNTKYINKLDFNNFINNNQIQYKNINNVNLWDYIVINNVYYSLYNKGRYYKVYNIQIFININQFQYLENEYNITLKDLKENKEFYEKDEIYQLKGKLNYISELLNCARHQLTNLKILK